MSAKNFARALLGQGLGLGWGDEAEAWLRSKMSDEDYDEILAQINQEYGDYSEASPVAAIGGEFAGAALPAIAAMMVPGGQGVGASGIMRLLGKAAAVGATQGGISGAGYAGEGERTRGALTGAALGGALGTAIPVASRSARGTLGWMRERASPSAAVVDRAAGKRMTRALGDAGMTAQDLIGRARMDAVLGEPGAVANSSWDMASLAEMAAQRAGKGASTIEKTLRKQGEGSRGRVYNNLAEGIRPGKYYADEQKLIEELRSKAGGLYEQAYAAGEINDPRIMEVLATPQFRAFFNKAQGIADLEGAAAKLRGEDPSKFKLRQIYREMDEIDPEVVKQLRASGISEETIRRSMAELPKANELVAVPDVRTLDYIKRGIDASIDSGFRGQGMSTAEANALKQLRNELVGAVDELAPDYKAARQVYAGDMEVLDAMRAGMNDFNKLDHEEVTKLFRGMGEAEQQAYRTGVARHLYSRIMEPSMNADMAKRVINSPETVAKLRPLFNNDSEFGLFQAALERESELMSQSNKILRGSPTSRREQMREAFEADPAGEAMTDLAQKGILGSLSGMVIRTIQGAKLPEPVAARLGEMLSAGSPDEVAAVVEILEKAAAQNARATARFGAAEAGVLGGGIGSSWPAPEGSKEQE